MIVQCNLYRDKTRSLPDLYLFKCCCIVIFRVETVCIFVFVTQQTLLYKDNPGTESHSSLSLGTRNVSKKSIDKPPCIDILTSTLLYRDSARPSPSYSSCIGIVRLPSPSIFLLYRDKQAIAIALRHSLSGIMDIEDHLYRDKST
jgi:hypothetical protein